MELNQSNIGDVFETKTKTVSDKLADFKTRRDQLNVKVRGQLDKRNEINSQDKELITEVQKQKTLRNEANGRVAELRKIRLEKTKELKEVRAKLRSSVEDKGREAGKKKNGPGPCARAGAAPAAEASDDDPEEESLAAGVEIVDAEDLLAGDLN